MQTQFIAVALLGFVIGVAACFFVLVVNDNLYTYPVTCSPAEMARGCHLVAIGNGGAMYRSPRFFIG